MGWDVLFVLAQSRSSPKPLGSLRRHTLEDGEVKDKCIIKSCLSPRIIFWRNGELVEGLLCQMHTMWVQTSTGRGGAWRTAL